ncbi:hypothetical protein V3C99_016324 [Haemonchus contortus]|uniref:Transposase n=1 Tax=Haemonchus contortus TaxID=6289 RepID=A0A7I4YYH4_HAECO
MRDAEGRPKTSKKKMEEIAVSYNTNLFRSTVPVSLIPTLTQDVAPRIEEWEVERVIRQMKPRKAPGPERISADFSKSASYIIIKQLAKRSNRYLDAQRISDQWKMSNTVLLVKKGQHNRMQNYHLIAFLSPPYNLFTAIGPLPTSRTDRFSQRLLLHESYSDLLSFMYFTKLFTLRFY